MDQNLRASIQTSTFYYFMIVTTLTTISQLTTMSVIVFADISGKENMRKKNLQICPRNFPEHQRSKKVLFLMFFSG